VTAVFLPLFKARYWKEKKRKLEGGQRGSSSECKGRREEGKKEERTVTTPATGACPPGILASGSPFPFITAAAVRFPTIEEVATRAAKGR